MWSLTKTTNIIRKTELPEEWGASIKQPVNEGMCFYVKYLGSHMVDKASSDTVTAEAIKTIIAMAKSKGNKKLPRVSLCIRPSGITTTDVTTGERLHDVSIYRISYCSADATYDRVVAFIATNKNETMECHAFLTSKRKVSQAAALTISQAFTIAFENWENSKTMKSAATATPANMNASTSASSAKSATVCQQQQQQQQQQPVTSTPMKGKTAPSASTTMGAGGCAAAANLLSEKNHNNPHKDISSTAHLIDLSLEEISRGNNSLHNSMKGHSVQQQAGANVTFDTDLDDSFSRLAHSRARDPQRDHQDHENKHPNADLLTLLPSNIKSLDLDEEIRQCFTSQRNARDDKFFAEKDDLLFL